MLTAQTSPLLSLELNLFLPKKTTSSRAEPNVFSDSWLLIFLHKSVGLSVMYSFVNSTPSLTGVMNELDLLMLQVLTFLQQESSTKFGFTLDLAQSQTIIVYSYHIRKNV